MTTLSNLKQLRGNVDVRIEAPLYYHLKRELEVDIRPYCEDKFADVSIYSNVGFSNVSSLQYNRNKREDILVTKHKNWFKDCLITIEHENKYEDAFTEPKISNIFLKRRNIIKMYFRTWLQTTTPQELLLKV